MIAFLILIGCLIASATADDTPSSSRGDLTFWADRACFARGDSLAYYEVYVQLLCRDFTFRDEDGLQRAEYVIEASLVANGKRVGVFDINGLRQDRLRWEKSLTAQSGTDLGNQVAVEAVAFRAPPGAYTITLRLQEPISKREGLCDLDLPAPPTTDLTLSDIQFGHRIETKDTADRLLKNDLWIVPNVGRLATQSAGALNIYFEVYGLTYDEASTGSFDLGYAIQDSTGWTIETLNTARYRKPGLTCPMTETLDLPDLAPGHYALEVTVRDSDTGNLARRARTFTVSETGNASLSTDPAALDRYLKQIRHIADSKDLEAYEKLSPEEKVSFILAFWKDRDPTPGTQVNEFALEHFRRTRYADENFPSRSSQQGSDTATGRVYIKYGPPSDIERSPLSNTGRPYEIWTYEHLGFYEFAFLDRPGDGVLYLAHSSMPGERHNPSWRDEQGIGDQTDPLATPGGFGPPDENDSGP